MKKKLIYILIFIILMPLLLNIYSIGKLFFTDTTITKAYFTSFYYIKRTPLSTSETLIKYMESKGWKLQDRFGASLIFEKDKEIKRFNLNDFIPMF